MHFYKILFFSLTIIWTSKVLAISGGLFPEDGSQAMKYWYYSGGKTGPRVPLVVIQNIEAAFRNEGIEPVVFNHYEWMQDILFFDQEGSFVELADLPVQSAYFDDLTMGVYENEGWASKLNKLTNKQFDRFGDISQSKLDYTFLEGGATISGRFSNGQNYLITYQDRIDRLVLANQNMDSSLTRQDIINRICLELNIEQKNLFLIPKIAGSEHLDLYMKAMPDGVLIIDEPSMRIEMVKSLSQSTQNPEYTNILNYEETDRYEYHKSFYLKKINIVVEYLASTGAFKIIRFPGRFFSVYEMDYGISYKRELINFFNGVSGQEFYITNKAPKTLELEKRWTDFLNQKFNISLQRIYFVGEYSDGSGLDCMGAGSP